MAGNQKWTAQDDEDLLHLSEAGYCAETVAQVLERSESAVQRRLAQIRRMEWDPLADDGWLREMATEAATNPAGEPIPERAALWPRKQA